MEAGRFFATECGYYVTKVVDSKRVENKKYCIVDGGINHVNYLFFIIIFNIITS